MCRAGGIRTPDRRFWRPMLYQLSYWPRRQPLRVPAAAEGLSAGLLVDRVAAVVRAILLHLQPLTIVDLRLHRDVVATFALGALEGDLHPLVVLRHSVLRTG